MLELSSNHKMDGLGVLGMSNFRRNWYQVSLSSPSRSKVIDKNLVSGGHFGFHASVTLCHGFSKSTFWIVERHCM